MKKMMFIIALLTSVAISATAQQKELSPEFKEKIFNGKAQIMQKHLKLSDEQMKEFLPIYKEYQEELAKITRPKRVKPANDSTISTDEAYNMQLSKIQFQENILNAQKNALAKLKTVLTPKQLMRFTDADKAVQKHIRDHKKGRKGNKHHKKFTHKGDSACKANMNTKHKMKTHKRHE